MIEFVSEELLGKITKNNRLAHQLLGPLRASIVQNQTNLEKIIKSKEEVTDALKMQRSLYAKNLELMDEGKIDGLQQAIEDFGISTTKKAGENMMLDMINAKRVQIEELESVMFEYQYLAGYYTYINNNMLAAEQSLLKISQKFEELIA